MRVLLIYPQYPDTFWSFKHALKFISKKAAVPPLGLITASALLPDDWEKRLVDLNIEKLRDKDLEWADYVFIGAMYVQKASVDHILERCRAFPAKVVAGGPLFTQEFQNYPLIDHFVLNEGEITFPLFLEDIQNGQGAKKVYRTTEYADLSRSPVPDYHLLKQDAYAFMSLQISRGCPYACDFCEITTLLGHKVRMKSNEQVLSELEALYRLNWRGSVSVVDDNLIGNKRIMKNELFPAMIDWMRAHKHPFTFSAQTSINLADDTELLVLMRDAGFTSTFIGIETPVEESLESCNKVQNKKRNLLENVKKIQKEGMVVSGGFIVGFDTDTPTVFQKQIDFIQKSGIVTAMVGLLNAPKHTRLYQQLEKEKRLMVDATGNNTDYTINFIPKMDLTQLLDGYQHIIQSIYKVKPYYSRIRELLMHYRPVKYGRSAPNVASISAFIKSVFVLGLFDRGRFEYWKFFAWTLVRKPNLFVDAMTMAVFGFHYRTVYGLRKTKGQQFTGTF